MNKQLYVFGIGQVILTTSIPRWEKQSPLSRGNGKYHYKKKEVGTDRVFICDNEKRINNSRRKT